jgi:hypothetical protein
MIWLFSASSFQPATTAGASVDTPVDAWLHLTRVAACRSVFPLIQFFAARDDSSVTPAPEGRHIIAQCVSTGNREQDASAPERGVRIRAQVHPSPRSGARQFAMRTPGSLFRPSGFAYTHFGLRLCRIAGRAISPAAVFQTAPEILTWAGRLRHKTPPVVSSLSHRCNRNSELRKSRIGTSATSGIFENRRSR